MDEQERQAASEGSSPGTGLSAEQKESQQWAMFMHLSLLTGVLVPFAGLVVPIVIWALKKDDFPDLKRHGNVIFNWMLSAVIYAIICLVLTLIVIGVFGLLALAILSIVFPIIGGIKANDGELWEYPLSIKFFK